MPTTDCATHVALSDVPGFDCHIETPQGASQDTSSQDTSSQDTSSQDTSRPLRGLFFGFAATVTVGLALASWYVGVRIVSADEVPVPAAVPVRPPSSVKTVATSQPAPSPAEDPMAEAYWYTVPLPQFYLQVAGLGGRQDATFVRALENKGFRAEIRTSQNEEGRIVIGPYSTHTELERAQRKLASAGVLAIQTDY